MGERCGSARERMCHEKVMRVIGGSGLSHEETLLELENVNRCAKDPQRRIEGSGQLERTSENGRTESAE